MKLRKTKLIEPRLQWKFALATACVAGLSTIVQSLVLNNALLRLAEQLPNDRVAAAQGIPPILVQSMFVTAAFLLPLSISVGILVSFKIAGPIYRFRIFLKDVVAGRKPVDCRIRVDDELQDFCDLLNEATAPVRAAATSDDEARAA